MKYVITGGAGFIGSHLATRLLRLGHDVVVIDNLFSGRTENIDAALRDSGAPVERLNFVVGDIVDGDAMGEHFEGAAAVFHQAAIASVPRSFTEPAATLRANIEGTMTMLEVSRSAGVETFVMASSTSVYGDSAILPTHERVPLAPLSPYALSKRVDEDLLAMWSREHGMRTVGLRYFNIFGPRQDPASEYAAVVPKFITRLLAGEAPIVYGDGLQSRDFTYVDNVVAANLLAGGVDPDDGRERPCAASGVAMNIGIGERYSLLDLVSALNDILGTSIEPRFEPARMGDVRDSQATIELAGEAIGYEPRVSFRRGLEATVEWFVAQRQRTDAVAS